MSNTFIDKIKQMHTKFGIANNEGPTQLSPKEKEFRINCLKEEVREFAEAQSLEDQLDAILDCVVFCMGTLERMGMLEIAEEAFKRIMQANMNKTIGTATKEREGGKSFKLDLVKPADWEAPQFSDLLNEKACDFNIKQIVKENPNYEGKFFMFNEDDSLRSCTELEELKISNCPENKDCEEPKEL